MACGQRLFPRVFQPPITRRSHRPEVGITSSIPIVQNGKMEDALAVALRVLTAIAETRRPDPEDVAILRQHSPLPVDASADEVARDVLMRHSPEAGKTFGGSL